MKNLDDATKNAIENFWKTIAENFPQIKCVDGDMPPKYNTFFLYCKDTVKWWMHENTTKEEKEQLKRNGIEYEF